MEKRRDTKGRILNNGESQRKDGRYAYKYIDASGRPQFIYSWKLVETDRVPKGKRNCLSLREKEQELRKDLADGIDSKGKKMTLSDLYEKQNKSRSNITENTLQGRKMLKSVLEHDLLGNRCIDSIKPSDAKEWALRMKEKGYAYQTIDNFKRSLKASFYIAIQDDYVRKNPFDFKLSDVLEDDTKSKEALTKDEEKRFLEFIKTDSTYKRHYDTVIILLNTGLRISELCGLTVKDLDFENRRINVDHQLLVTTASNYYINAPKTKSGIRQIPMSETVSKAFERVLEQQKNAQPIEIDGYSRFIFLNNQGYPMYGKRYVDVFKKMIVKYNKTHDDSLPNITPHILRHTFCTKLANRNMNPKSLQYLMGHSNIATTLNLYTHASIDGIQEELQRLIS